MYKLKIGTQTDAAHPNYYCKIHFKSCQYSKIAQYRAKNFALRMHQFSLLTSAPAVIYISAVGRVTMTHCTIKHCICVYLRNLQVPSGQSDQTTPNSDVTPIPKGEPSSSVANYRPISITSVLSKVFERLVSVRLGRFMEHSGVLPTT